MTTDPTSILTLAIETSSQIAEIAILRDEDVIVESALGRGQPRQAQQLITELADLLGHHKIHTHDINLICISQGPGSFTGLRIGIVFAKTLAYACHCELVGVPTFQVIADQTPLSYTHVEVIEDLRQQQIATEVFSYQDQRWTSTAPAKAVHVDVWTNQRNSQIPLSGAGIDRMKFLDPSWELIPQNYRQPRAVTVGRSGISMRNQDLTSDPMRLLPIYIRRSAAEEKAQSMNQEE